MSSSVRRPSRSNLRVLGGAGRVGR